MEKRAIAPVNCSECGYESPPGMRFCGQCGDALVETASSGGPPEAVEGAVEEQPAGLAEVMEVEEAPKKSVAEEALEDLIEIVEEEAQELAEDVVKDLIREQAPAHLTCGVCGMANPPDATHCELCGAVVAPAGAPCPACGCPNEAGSLFCDNCGERLGLTDLL